MNKQRTSVFFVNLDVPEATMATSSVIFVESSNNISY